MSRSPSNAAARIAETQKHIADFERMIADPSIHPDLKKGIRDTLQSAYDEVDAIKTQTERTRNYVTWDQGVLDRMKLLERNGESMIDALR